ncbi:uncharacterized protein EDB91DRAFT_1259493 [Suillus paluster]|uniref:uncharacterized protein n=1 Tax=Suillus paluster TaxID=48578 RepID=UPI001B8679B5|nr:uncharacterized protein EDB91DRAFT_1259493 [Suillus paluster]KAG1717613.1 hypothetical protein EDB91DRAFT_1259493 [Suillus paluster]
MHVGPDPPSFPIAGPPAYALSAMPPASSLAPMAPSQLSPLASATSVAGFDMTNRPATETTKTHWLINNTNCLDQFDVPNAVNSPWTNQLSYQSLRIVSRGRLVVSKRTELRLRLWRAQYPDVPLWFFAARCLSRGLDWRVFVSQYDLVGPNPAHSIPRPSYLDDAHLPLANRDLQQYEHRVRALLQLPYARRLLSMGGILWRIALHYGPASLISAALSGPSTDACMHLRADRVGSDIDDTVTPDAIALLLGTTRTGHSLWPPVDIFDRYQFWQGEWSPKWEEWFNGRIAGIHHHMQHSLLNRTEKLPDLFLSRTEWSHAHRRHTAVSFKSSTVAGTDAHAARLCEEVDQLYPPTESYVALV